MLREQEKGGAGWTWGRAGLVALFAATLLGGAAAWKRHRDPLGGWPPRWAVLGGPPDVGLPLRLLHTVRLTPRATLHVVTWRGAEWLIGCSEAGIDVLGGPPPVEERQVTTAAPTLAGSPAGTPAGGSP